MGGSKSKSNKRVVTAVEMPWISKEEKKDLFEQLLPFRMARFFFAIETYSNLESIKDLFSLKFSMSQKSSFFWLGQDLIR